MENVARSYARSNGSGCGRFSRGTGIHSMMEMNSEIIEQQKQRDNSKRVIAMRKRCNSFRGLKSHKKERNWIWIASGFGFLVLCLVIITGSVLFVEYSQTAGWVIFGVGVLFLLLLFLLVIYLKLKERKGSNKKSLYTTCKVYHKDLNDFPYDPILKRACTVLNFHGHVDCELCSQNFLNVIANYRKMREEELESTTFRDDIERNTDNRWFQNSRNSLEEDLSQDTLPSSKHDSPTHGHYSENTERSVVGGREASDISLVSPFTTKTKLTRYAKRLKTTEQESFEINNNKDDCHLDGIESFQGNDSNIYTNKAVAKEKLSRKIFPASIHTVSSRQPPRKMVKHDEEGHLSWCQQTHQDKFKQTNSPFPKQERKELLVTISNKENWFSHAAHM